MELDTRHLSAVDAARLAGSYIRDQTTRSGYVKDDEARELVTESDRHAENLIRETISAAHPSDGFLGEEFGFKKGESGYTWVVDPIDGTTNYTHHIPEFCVAVAVMKDNQPCIGVVYDPNRDMCYDAMVDRGARCNGTSIHTRPRPLAPESLFGFSTRFIGSHCPDHVRRILAYCDEYRNMGSAALHLCYVARGWLDGTFADSTRLWDVAAGGLILAESGGSILDFTCEPVFPLKLPIDQYRERYVPMIGTNGALEQSPFPLRSLFEDGSKE